MKKIRRVLASVAAVAMLAGVVASPVMSVSAVSQVLGETSFDYKMLPWRPCQSDPAKQDFTLEDGSLHIKIIKAQGLDGEMWDLSLSHKNLSFRAGHEYKVSFKAKAKRAGMELYSHISNLKGDMEYFVLQGDKMENGPEMGGDWDKGTKLTTEYQEFSGTFIPDRNIEPAQWTFQYANGNTYGGNAVDGDDIWFDDMSIECQTCDYCGNVYGINTYGAVSRDYSAYADPDTCISSGKLVNFISVNQIGYYTYLSKVAVLGDNKGDIYYGSSTINLTEDTYDFDVCNADTGEVAYSGTSTKKMIDKDSGDRVCKLDFSKLTTPGEYYIRVGDWRSFKFRIGDDIYSESGHNMLTNAMNYFYQNRSGVDIEKKYITSGDIFQLSHMGYNKTDSASVQKIWNKNDLTMDEATDTYASSEITANGGWHDSDNYCKNVSDGGISLWTLQNMYERAFQSDEGGKKFADASGTVVIPESGNKIPDVLDEAAYELDWMSSMVVQPDEPEWGKYAGLVYNEICDYKWTGLTIDHNNYNVPYDPPRIVKPPTFAATLSYAACAAQAARLWEPYDPDKAAKYFDQAKKAYEAYEKYWYEAKADEEDNDKSLYPPLYQAKNGVPFTTADCAEVRDDAYWAACEIFISAKKMDDLSADDYYKKLTEYDHSFEVTARISNNLNYEGTLSSFNSDNPACAGSLSLALHKDLLSYEETKKLEDSIIESANEYIRTEDIQGYGIPYLYDGPGCIDPSNIDPPVVIRGYEYGSNSMVLNNAIVMAYAYDQTNDRDYIRGVSTAMDYLLGTNPLSFSYITGYGTYHEQNPYHKYWQKELKPDLPNAPDGVLSGGPNAGLQDEYIKCLGFVPGDMTPSQRCFVDSVESWSTNEVSVNLNSQLAWVVSFLQDEAPVNIPPRPETDIKYGDTDSNGTVDLSDLLKLSQHLLKDITLSDDALKVADCNGDGEVGINDLALLKQYVMKDPITLGPKI